MIVRLRVRCLRIGTARPKLGGERSMNDARAENAGHHGGPADIDPNTILTSTRRQLETARVLLDAMVSVAESWRPALDSQIATIDRLSRHT